jgi:cysteine desulfurase family protein (TIGR01976 family)
MPRHDRRPEPNARPYESLRHLAVHRLSPTLPDMLDIDQIRAGFPALARQVGGSLAVFLDGPAGTQVPQQVIEATRTAMASAMSNVGGSFAGSQETERLVGAARLAAADLVGGGPDEIVFGPNMTTLTFALSRALSEEWKAGDRIIVSRLDHDANVEPWVRAAGARGVEVAYADLRPDDVTLDDEHLESLIDRRTRLVAVTACSNAFGTLVDVARVCRAAATVGALTYIDAVHLAPHRAIDVAVIGCDFLVGSSYKFFGPHLGVLWGKTEHLRRLAAFRVRPAPALPPGKWETGTGQFELMAGFTAAVEYLASLGVGEGRRQRLIDAYDSIAAHENRLGQRFLSGLPAGTRTYGRLSMEGRVPTFAVEVAGKQADEVAAQLGHQGIFVWSGHYYAVEPMARLGLLERGGLVRIGLVHYNTEGEVDRVSEALSDLAD